jgi:hypothetical protein
MGDTPSELQAVSDLPCTSQSTQNNVSQCSGSPQSERKETRNSQQRVIPLSVAHGSYSNMQESSSLQNLPHIRYDSLNMASFGSALPEHHHYGNFSQQQRYPTGSSALFQYQNLNTHYASPTSVNASFTSLSHGIQYPPQYQGLYTPTHNPLQNLVTGVGGNQFYPGYGYIGQQQQAEPGFYMQTAQYGSQNQIYPGAVSPRPYMATGSFVTESRLATQHSGNDDLVGSPKDTAQGRSNGVGEFYSRTSKDID